MATYVVFTRERTRDASELAAYAPKARASIEGHPVTVLAAYDRQEVLEGPQVNVGRLAELGSP